MYVPEFPAPAVCRRLNGTAMRQRKTRTGKAAQQARGVLPAQKLSLKCFLSACYKFLETLNHSVETGVVTQTLGQF